MVLHDRRELMAVCLPLKTVCMRGGRWGITPGCGQRCEAREVTWLVGLPGLWACRPRPAAADRPPPRVKRWGEPRRTCRTARAPPATREAEKPDGACSYREKPTSLSCPVSVLYPYRPLFLVPLRRWALRRIQVVGVVATVEGQSGYESR